MSTPIRPSRTVMSTPSTPNRIHPTLNRTPGSKLKAKGEASPQVKAAIAAMKSAALLKQSPATPSSSTAHCTASPAYMRNGEENTPTARSRELNELGDGWAGKSTNALVSDARRTGRLNLSTRALTSVPASAYNTLIPLSSVYHSSTYISSVVLTPSRSASSSPFILGSSVVSGRDRMPEERFEVEEEEEDEGEDEDIEWTQLDLKVLNLSNNEITRIDDQIAGFEDLEVLDLHCNLLTTVPLSLLLLKHLTSLNLSSNHLTRFPLQILALSSLRTIDLSRNPIQSLWSNGNDWHSDLTNTKSEWEQAAENTLGSPSRSPTNRTKIKSLIHSSASSSSRSASPFPHLLALNLSHTRLGVKRHSPSSIADSTFVWPISLTSLDLSNAMLGDDGISLDAMSRLTDLVSLDLAGNFLTFDHVSTSSPFASLVRLNLSENQIDTLAGVEAIFTPSVSASGSNGKGNDASRMRREIVYEGLEKPLKNLIESDRAMDATKRSTASDNVIRITVEGNRLTREEGERRAKILRKRNGCQTGNARAETSTASVDEYDVSVRSDSVMDVEVMEELSDELAEKLEEIQISPPDESPAAIDSSAIVTSDIVAASDNSDDELECDSPPPIIRPVLPIDPRLLAFFYSYYISATKQLPLRSLTLTALPDSVQDLAAFIDDDERPFISFSPPVSPTKRSDSPRKPTAASVLQGQEEEMESMILTPSAIDLSFNSIQLFPLCSIVVLNWTTTLRKLDLSNNRIFGIQRSTVLDDDWADIVMTGLRELNLRNNMIGDYIGFESLCLPGELEEGRGKMKTLEWIAKIGPNLVELDMGGNKLTTLDGLASLLLPSFLSSTSVRNGNVGVRKGLQSLRLAGNQIANLDGLALVAEMVRGKDTKGGQLLEEMGWRCDQIDLSGNAIARLPPVLGHLPLALSIPVAGNRFRIPGREISESGGRVLMEWLRARVS